MPTDELFLESRNERSGRFAVFEDDGVSGWLYLTEPGTRKPVADAWVYNRIPAPDAKEIKSTYRNGPPPAAQGYASDAALVQRPREHEWSFLWAADGESVAIVKDDLPIAFIAKGKERGVSRELLRDGPWGSVWSEALFDSTF